MGHQQIASAHGVGLATLTHVGAVLDTWFPSPALGLPPDTEAGTVPDEFAALLGPDPARGVELVVVRTAVPDLQAPPADAHDVYLRLHLLSHRLV
ncbi:MAG: 2,3,4,5-tetrahydropyridine-2,6-dicarboxylate N-succinyltransferase, partial [Pseudonocardiaceae bacterium]